jgi:hypothetical protein
MCVLIRRLFKETLKKKFSFFDLLNDISKVVKGTFTNSFVVVVVFFHCYYYLFIIIASTKAEIFFLLLQIFVS